MTKHIIHTTVLVTIIAFSYALSKFISTEIDLQVTAILFVLYFILKKVLPGKKDIQSEAFSTHSLLDSVFFTLIIMNIVYSTGGPASPLFFLTYFLVFALGLLIEPVQSMTTAFAIIIFLLLDLPEGFSNMTHLIPILSLPFLTPFALFLGKEFRKVEYQRKIITRLTNKKKLLEDEIFEEKKDYGIFLSLIVKEHLKKISHHAENFTGDHDLAEIRKSTHRMEKLIDAYEKTL